MFSVFLFIVTVYVYPILYSNVYYKTNFILWVITLTYVSATIQYKWRNTKPLLFFRLWNVSNNPSIPEFNQLKIIVIFFVVLIFWSNLLQRFIQSSSFKLAVVGIHTAYTFHMHSFFCEHFFCDINLSAANSCSIISSKIVIVR